MDPIKEAFQKIKEEIFSLREEVELLRAKLTSSSNPTHSSQILSQNNIPTNNPTHSPTVPQEIKGSRITNNDLSTGNQGVPTDNQTNRQTGQQTDNYLSDGGFHQQNDTLEDLDKAKEILDSLDNLKKALRIKFKRLTPQEMLIFSTLYNLDNLQLEEVSYKLISSHLNLSESSIRDYTNKLIKKGIPIEKHRLNNKKIVLSVSPELKRIATLSTIIKLREL